MTRILASLALGCAVVSAAVAGDPAGHDRGALLAATCGGCHRDGPVKEDGIPGFAGLDAEEIVQKLSAYRSGDLRGTLMNRIARGYTEAEIRLLGAALGSPSE